MIIDYSSKLLTLNLFSWKIFRFSKFFLCKELREADRIAWKMLYISADNSEQSEHKIEKRNEKKVQWDKPQFYQCLLIYPSPLVFMKSDKNRYLGKWCFIYWNQDMQRNTYYDHFRSQYHNEALIWNIIIIGHTQSKMATY